MCYPLVSDAQRNYFNDVENVVTDEVFEQYLQEYGSFSYKDQSTSTDLPTDPYKVRKIKS